MVEPRAASVEPGPRVDGDTVRFAFGDPQHYLNGVRLEVDRGLWAEHRDFEYQDGTWVLSVPRPPVQRLEYKLQLVHPDGGTETVLDPAAHGTAPGAFGDKSVLQMPGYKQPTWLDPPRRWEPSVDLRVPSRGGPIDVSVLSPEEPTTRLVVAHDGPEYDRLAALGVYAAAMVERGRSKPFHLALASPGPRDERYSANPGYAAALATKVIPALHRALRTRAPVVLMGASLGGLAALHAQRRHPRGIGGLFLQSASFFVPAHDEIESGYAFYKRVTQYVATVHNGPRPAAAPVPVTMTCGIPEENVHNNRLMAKTLREQGYRARLHEVPDMHNFTAWRDAFDPHLTDLLTTVWGRPDA
jgi:enterochelin esterase-like enzyme